MVSLESVRAFLKYSDWANDALLRTGGTVTDEQLDRMLDIGRGTLRKTLLHIWAGESVWIQRWQGKTETPWPNEEERVDVSAIRERFGEVYRGRDAFLTRTTDADLKKIMTYRDSKGSLFTATLGDMMMQMIVHSTHHRAQAVNILRRVGASAPELDYMMWVRKPL